MEETLKFEKRLSKAFSQIIPALKHVKILRHWAGFYAITPDHNPLLGEYKINGHYLASGFSGHGFMMSPIVGKSISELVLNGETEYSLEYFDPYRIDRGELRELALQMGYIKIQALSYSLITSFRVAHAVSCSLYIDIFFPLGLEM